MMKMRTFAIAAALSIIAGATPALADHGNWSGGGGHGGGGWHGGGGGGWHGGGGGGWHGGTAWRGGGGWHGDHGWRGGWGGGRGWYGGGFGFGGFVGPGWGYPYGVDPYAYSGAYPYPPMAPAAVPVAPGSATLYYCRSSAAYYPTVPTCPEPWVMMPAP
jgi:hypothetical protein